MRAAFWYNLFRFRDVAYSDVSFNSDLAGVLPDLSGLKAVTALCVARDSQDCYRDLQCSDASGCSLVSPIPSLTPLAATITALCVIAALCFARW